jgi:Protein of unknown function, DUF255
MLSVVSQSRCPSPRSLLRLLAWTTVAVAFFVVPATADTAPEVHTNRLIDSASPYLLQHAHNPVDWYPWGKEAIGKARKENKLIFLSIGYSTCIRSLLSNSSNTSMAIGDRMIMADSLSSTAPTTSYGVFHDPELLRWGEVGLPRHHKPRHRSQRCSCLGPRRRSKR